MNCEEASALMADQLAGPLQAQDERRLEEHLRSCPVCGEESATVTMLCAEMDGAEEVVPSARMRARFHAALAAYEDRVGRRRSLYFREWLWSGSMTLMAGMAASLFVVGLLIGRGFDSAESELDTLRQEVRVMSLALLDHQSASERLLGVAWSARDASAEQVTDALLDVVRNDRNVNVRLAAVEALSNRIDRPDVAEALLDAAATEQAPLLQVALVELLLERNVGNATTVARQLLETENLDPAVREFVRTSLNEVEEVRAADAI
jgi:hypothetical protein